MKLIDLVNIFGCQLDSIYRSLRDMQLIEENVSIDEINLNEEVGSYIRRKPSWNEYEFRQFTDGFLRTIFFREDHKFDIHQFNLSPAHFVNKYGIFNYKVFREEVNIKIKPITLLFGPNSSGKSSVLRSLLSFGESTPNSAYKPKAGSDAYLLDSEYYGFSHDFQSTKILERLNFTKYNEYNSESKPEYYKLLEKVLSNAENIAVREYIDPVREKGSRMELVVDGKLFLQRREADSTGGEYQAVIERSSDKVLNILSYEWARSIFGDEDIQAKHLKPLNELMVALINSCRFNGGYITELVRPVVDKNQVDIKNSWSSSISEIKSLNKGEDIVNLVENFHFSVVKVINLLLEAIYTEREAFFNEITYLGPLRPIPEPYFTSRNDRRNTDRTEWDPLLEGDLALDYVNEWLFSTDKLDMGIKLIKVIYQKAETYWQSHYKLASIYDALFEEKSDWAEELEMGNREESDRFKSNDTDITFLRVRDMRRGLDLDYTEVGVGISQVLPVIAACCEDVSGRKQICIEQPELHLHPALQARLGDLFIEASLGTFPRLHRTGNGEDDFEVVEEPHSKSLLIETHSEHLILRILRRIKETTLYKEQGMEFPEGFIPVTPEDVAVHYVSPGEEGSTIKELPITTDGDFAENWPNGFFDERLDELI